MRAGASCGEVGLGVVDREEESVDREEESPAQFPVAFELALQSTLTMPLVGLTSEGLQH